jgi:hypothetical protein
MMLQFDFHGEELLVLRRLWGPSNRQSYISHALQIANPSSEAHKICWKSKSVQLIF